MGIDYNINRKETVSEINRNCLARVRMPRFSMNYYKESDSVIKWRMTQNRYVRGTTEPVIHHQNPGTPTARLYKTDTAIS